MIAGKPVLGIIPARGGSRGIPRKNVRLAGGKPLIAWTIQEAHKSKYIDRVVLSSEDPEIIEVAVKCGCEVPFRRPLELASDDAPGIAPVLHAIEQLSGYFYVILLQPTSPLRNHEDIDGCLERCENGGAPSCVSVVKCREHPYLMFSVSNNFRLHRLVGEANVVHRRQDYPDFFLLNGAVYVAQVEWLRNSRTFISAETLGFEMPEERSLDIDTEEDLRDLECRLSRPRP